jgi:hypothetical protein
MLRPSVASRIKRMELCVCGVLQDQRINKDLRKWLTKVASNLIEAEPQLAQLSVKLINYNYDRYGYMRRGTSGQFAGAETTPIQKGQYVLEPLINIRGVESVVIEGEFRDCFPTKLARVMKSRDILLPVVEYDDKIVWRRRYGQKRKSKLALPGKKWFEPAYDWSVVEEVEHEKTE